MTEEVAKVKEDPLRKLVASMGKEIENALPALGVTTERLGRVFMTEVRKTPKLMQCSQQSLAAALMQSAELGLEFGSAIGHIYMIPFKNEATTIIGYRGLLELMRRSGEVKSLSVHVVYEADKFDYELGLVERLSHKPSTKPVNERGQITHSYFVAHFNNGGHHIEIMDKSEIDAIRNSSMGKNHTPWTQHYAEMAKKSVIRRAAKLMPSKIMPVNAFQDLEKEDVIEGEWITQEEAPALEAGKMDIGKQEATATDSMPEYEEEL